VKGNLVVLGVEIHTDDPFPLCNSINHVATGASVRSLLWEELVHKQINHQSPMQNVGFVAA
jgi:hypothetical protein